jgi:hypothetical protein
MMMDGSTGAKPTGSAVGQGQPVAVCRLVDHAVLAGGLLDDQVEVVVKKLNDAAVRVVRGHRSRWPRTYAKVTYVIVGWSPDGQV